MMSTDTVLHLFNASGRDAIFSRSCSQIAHITHNRKSLFQGTAASLRSLALFLLVDHLMQGCTGIPRPCCTLACYGRCRREAVLEQTFRVPSARPRPANACSVVPPRAEAARAVGAVRNVVDCGRVLKMCLMSRDLPVPAHMAEDITL